MAILKLLSRHLLSEIRTSLQFGLSASTRLWHSCGRWKFS